MTTKATFRPLPRDKTVKKLYELMLIVVLTISCNGFSQFVAVGMYSYLLGFFYFLFCNFPTKRDSLKFVIAEWSVLNLFVKMNELIETKFFETDLADLGNSLASR